MAGTELCDAALAGDEKKVTALLDGRADIEGTGAEMRVVDDPQERCADLSLDAVETDAKQRLRNAYEEWTVDPTDGHAEWLGIVVPDRLEAVCEPICLVGRQLFVPLLVVP